MLSEITIMFLFKTIIGDQGFGPYLQDWGFVEVRDRAHMFWWLFHTTANVSKSTDRPLIIWLQGGPGASSTAYGNFGEIGPLDTDLNYRNSTWIRFANLLFVDNPVGTGFSYVENGDLYTRTNTEIAQDFLFFLIKFFEKLPQYQQVPTYIFSESYGGKMAVEIALVLAKAKENRKIKLNFKGVVLGDSWISPVDFVMTWPKYLLNLGFVDNDGYEDIMEAAFKVEKSIRQENYTGAFINWRQTQNLIESVTGGVDFYNVLNIEHQINRTELFVIMDKVKIALNLSVKWNEGSSVFSKLSEDFMKPVTHIVEEILNTTHLKVAVYNGQLDLIVDTPGTLKWIRNLNYKDKNKWEKTTRSSFFINKRLQGYVKKYENFSFYWINRAGHMIIETLVDYFVRFTSKILLLVKAFGLNTIPDVY